MNEKIETELTEIAESRDKDFEAVKAAYEDKLEVVEERLVGEESEEEKQKYALQLLRSESIQKRRTRGSVEELPILAIGHGGTRPFGDGQAVMAYGIINPEDARPGLAVFICKSEDVDLDDIRAKFQTLNTLRGYFTRNESDNFDPASEKQVYVCNATEDSYVEEVSPDDAPDSSPISELPTDREAKRDLINENFMDEPVQLANIHEHLSKTDPESGYTVDFGADVKRMRGQIVDAAVFEDSDSGLVVVLDDSVSPEELGDDVVGEQQRVPGLGCWIPPEFVEYGENSIVDIYGTVSVSDDGQVSMNGCGIVPIISFDYEGQSGGGSNDNVETETI